MHFVHYSRPCYQKDSFKAAMKHVKKLDCAVDIGAHIGFFSIYMAEKFKEVHAFEPEPDNFECLKLNIPPDIFVFSERGIRTVTKINLWNHGIAEKDMLGNMFNPAPHNTGAWQFSENSEGTARVMRLGANISPDLIKIDVQGYEKRALLGCKEVIERDNPVILVECRRGGEAAVYLESIGYEQAERTGSNMTWVHK